VYRPRLSQFAPSLQVRVFDEDCMATSKLASPNRRVHSSAASRLAAGVYPPESRLISEESFLHYLQLEQRRTERSGRSFLLILISGEGLDDEARKHSSPEVITALSGCIRETDVLGWYEKSLTLGLIMTEIGDASSQVIEAIVRKISAVLQECLGPDLYCQMAVTVRVFPEGCENRVFNRRRSKHSVATRVDSWLKRCIDIAGSLIALLLLSPIFAVIAIGIKLSSKGPVFYCKQRVGQNGNEFPFYKFRTMYVNNDSSIHREYVTKLISGSADARANGGLFKLKNDPRITRIGKFLRRTSLDELPQFFNVLLNHMSLVGPRPPLRYEYEKYSTWHKRRVRELKPGITGLWQVEARSVTTFDEMARIDIRYAKARNLWLDLVIMLRTPAAMFSGRGAC
jgi:lipopolysaccharide/colanic/teichoic acid biosynthesis glycosyltransferase